MPNPHIDFNVWGNQLGSRCLTHTFTNVWGNQLGGQWLPSQVDCRLKVATRTVSRLPNSFSVWILDGTFYSVFIGVRQWLGYNIRALWLLLVHVDDNRLTLTMATRVKTGQSKLLEIESTFHSSFQEVQNLINKNGKRSNLGESPRDPDCLVSEVIVVAQTLQLQLPISAKL